MSKIQL